MQKGIAHCFPSSPQLGGKGDQIEKIVCTGCRACVLTEHVRVPEKSINASEPSL